MSLRGTCSALRFGTLSVFAQSALKKVSASIEVRNFRHSTGVSGEVTEPPTGRRVQPSVCDEVTPQAAAGALGAEGRLVADLPVRLEGTGFVTDACDALSRKRVMNTHRRG